MNVRQAFCQSPADADIRGIVLAGFRSKDAAAAWQCVPWPWLTEIVPARVWRGLDRSSR